MSADDRHTPIRPRGHAPALGAGSDEPSIDDRERRPRGAIRVSGAPCQPDHMPAPGRRQARALISLVPGHDHAARELRSQFETRPPDDIPSRWYPGAGGRPTICPGGVGVNLAVVSSSLPL